MNYETASCMGPSTDPASKRALKCLCATLGTIGMGYVGWHYFAHSVGIKILMTLSLAGVGNAAGRAVGEAIHRNGEALVKKCMANRHYFFTEPHNSDNMHEMEELTLSPEDPLQIVTAPP